MGASIMDLDEILASMSVRRRGEFVYASIQAIPPDIDLLAAIWESEGLSAVVPVECAAMLGAGSGPVFTCLTLEVYSALESVGLTAVVSAVLADHGISCNVIAGLNHDHLLVPAARADESIQLLERLAQTDPG